MSESGDQRARRWGRRSSRELKAAAQAAQDSEAEIRRQHDVVMAAIRNGAGLSDGCTEWRDDDYRQWDYRLARVVECPACAFTFGAEHTDWENGVGAKDSYTCPNCDKDES